MRNFIRGYPLFVAQEAVGAGETGTVQSVGDACLLRFLRDDRWFGNLRDLQVLVDGIPRAKVGSMGSVTVQVAPGEHTVEVKMDWCRTAPVFVECLPASTVQFLCSPRSMPVVLFVGFLAPSEVFTVRRMPAGTPSPGPEYSIRTGGR